MQSIKEHNLKANHNLALFLNPFLLSVCNLSKNTIWKQITTIRERKLCIRPLYAIYQRTQSESKSQLNRCPCVRYRFCMQSIKEHNLKANHNGVPLWSFRKFSVCNLSKNTIWKQITTMGVMENSFLLCMQSIKEHNLKANHNLNRIYNAMPNSVCNLSKNTIWKQITTQLHLIHYRQYLYAIYQRTQSESKSQLNSITPGIQSVCMQSIKEHNLKANHN